MSLRKIINNWAYLGYDEETINKNKYLLNDSNMKILKYGDITAIVVNIVILLFYVFFIKNNQRTIIHLISLVVYVLIYFMIKYINKSRWKDNTNVINKLIMFTIVATYLPIIFMDTFASGNQLAVTGIWLTIVLTVVFDTLPVQKLMIIPLQILFAYCSIKAKPHEVSLIDIHNIYVSLIIGIVSSWQKTKFKFKSELAKQELDKKNRELYILSTSDPLTKLFNRRYIFKEFEKAAKQCKENGTSLACLIMDLDDFKAYNDFYGHPKGDELISSLGKLLRSISEKYGIRIGRIGGEEFLAVWEVSEFTKPEVIAEEIRKAVIDLKIDHIKSSVNTIVTISQGLYIDDKNKDMDIERIYVFADNALYEAKKNGKNQCEIIKS